MRAKLHERIRDGLAQLVVWSPEGASIDYSRDSISQGDGGHGKHGTTTAAPPRVNALAQEWAEFFARAADMLEHDLARERGQLPAVERRIGSAGRVSSGVTAQRKARIRREPLYRGRPAQFVAYVEGCGEDLVLKARAAAGLDPFGLPIPKARPLTSRELPHPEPQED